MNRDWLCIAAGVALGEVFAYALKSFFWSAAIIYMVVVFILLKMLKAEDSRRRMFIIIALSAVLGSLRMGTENLVFNAALPANEIRVESITLKEDRYTLFGGRTMVYYTPDEGEEWKVKIGNRIRFDGDVERIEGARNPGEFDFSLHYKSQGTVFRCFADSVSVTDGKTDILKQGIYDIRMMLLNRLTLLFGEDNEDDGAFLRAALLGDKSTLSDELYDLYRDNGIAHLLAISGLHVSILGMGLYGLLRRLGLGYGLSGLIAGALLILYNMLTGSGVSTSRAVIMLLLSFLAAVKGRSYDLLSAGGFASSVLMLLHPYLLFTSGFLLSFGAVLSIGGPAGTIMKRLGLSGTLDREREVPGENRLIAGARGTWGRIKHDLASAFVVSATVQLFTLPVTVYFFFSTSLYGFILNLAVIPLMTYVLWSGLAALLLCFVSPVLGLIAGGSGHYILKLYRWICEKASALPCSTVLIGRPALWKIFVYYFCLFALLYFFPGRCRKQS